MALHAQIPKPPKDPPPEPVRKPNGEPLEDPLEPPDERPPSPVPEPPYEIPPEPPPASSDDAPVKVWTVGRNGRPVVTAYDGDRDLHLELLEQGWAVAYRPVPTGPAQGCVPRCGGRRQGCGARAMARPVHRAKCVAAWRAAGM